MKKFLGILAIAATMVACNNTSEGGTDGDTTNTGGDTTMINNNINTPAPDTTGGMGDTTNRTGDTTGTRP